MADRYLKATGNWNDNNTWSATDGGAAGASFPTASDNVHFTANSDGLTLTINVSSNCIDFVADEANTATIAGSSFLRVTGDVTLHANMTISWTSTLYARGTSSITSVGKTLTSLVADSSGSNVTLLDALTISSHLYLQKGSVDLNGQTVTCATFFIQTAEVRTLTMGASVVNCTAWSVDDVTNLTFNVNTSTIKVTGTGVFKGAGLTYNNVELNGTAHTISGDGNVFKALKIGRAAAVTITGTAGDTYTVRSFFATNNTNTLTMASTGAAWTLTGNSGYCELDYTALTNVVAGYPYIYYAGDNSTDNGGNTDWIFTRKVRQQMFPRR